MNFSILVYAGLPTGYVYIYLNYLVGERLHEYLEMNMRKIKPPMILSLEITLYWGWKLHYNLPAVDNYMRIFPFFYFFMPTRRKVLGLCIRFPTKEVCWKWLTSEDTFKSGSDLYFLVACLKNFLGTFHKGHHYHLGIGHEALCVMVRSVFWEMC